MDTSLTLKYNPPSIYLSKNIIKFNLPPSIKKKGYNKKILLRLFNKLINIYLIENLRMKLNVGDVLLESMSQNIGAIIRIFNHPDGKLVKIRWRMEGHLPHDTEHLYKRVLRCVKNGQYELTPKIPTSIETESGN